MMVNLLTTSLFNLASLGSLICNGFFDDNETKLIFKEPEFENKSLSNLLNV